MSTTEISGKVRVLTELRLMVDDLVAELTSLEDIIKTEMTTRYTEEMTIDIFYVRWTTFNSYRFDDTAFKATHAELNK